MNNNIYIIFFLSVLAWFILSNKAIREKYYLTQWQKHFYEDTLLSFGMILSSVVFFEAILYSVLEDTKINKNIIILIIISINLFLSFLFREKEENNKKIYAKQSSNFTNLPIQKVVKFNKFIKNETDVDLNYYHLKPIHKANDMTVDSIKLNRVTIAEYKYMKTIFKVVKFKNHIVYQELISYYNKYAKEYDLKKINYEKFILGMENKKRIEAERYIVSLFEKLVEKKIPIRISQLLQHSKNRKYLSNYIYYLMSLESKKFVSNSILYFILFYEFDKNKKA